MVDRLFLVVWGCFMLIGLYNVVMGRDRADRKPHQIAMEHYMTSWFGTPEPSGPWVAATVVILLLLGLFFLWVGSFG